MKKVIAIVASLLILLFVINFSLNKNKLKPPQRKPEPIKKEQKKPNQQPIRKEEKRIIGSYTTIVGTTNFASRIKNMQNTIDLLNNKRISPGQEFSFNKTIGPVTSKNGFVEAPIIDDDGQMSPGVGGGMCQVTTTLYNAVMEAGLEVTERHPHSKPVTYVAPGRDATVYDDKDLKFINNKNLPVEITGQVNGNKITLNIYQIVK